MIDGLNYYQILGLPEDALLKEIQSAWRKIVKENHEDLVPQDDRQAAKERMFKINEAYEVLSDEDKRAHYDNSHMLNGGSKIELVRMRVRKAKEIFQLDKNQITRDEIKTIESIIDYLDQNTQITCFNWMVEILHTHPEMARHTVSLAFDEQLLGVNTQLFNTLLEKFSYTISFEKVHLYGEDIIGVAGKKNKERNYNQFSRVLYHRPDLANYFVYPAFQEQISGCESGLLRTLLDIAPETINQVDFDHYIDTVNTIKWHLHSQLRSYNEQAIHWILKARPDLMRKPEKKQTTKELPFPLRSRP